MKTLATLACLVSTIATSALAFDDNNKPSWILGNSYETKLSNLPGSASLSHETTPWANSFWPHIYGGIAFRWNNHYKQTPTFAAHHDRISNIKDRVTDLQKSIFIKNLNRADTLKVISEIESLKSDQANICLLYTSPSPRDRTRSRMPSSA